MTVRYRNDALELGDYVVSVDATAEYDYDPGCMYMRNGDPGYPPEESFELQEVEAVWYLGEDEIEPTPEMDSQLVDWLDNHSDLFKEE